MTDNSKMLLYFQLGARSFAQGTINEGTTLFSSVIDLENAKKFDSSNNLEDDEWFFVDLSSKSQGKKIITIFKDSIDNSLNTISKENYKNIKSIHKKKGNELIFQRIYPKQRMDNLVLRILEKDTVKIKKITGITIQQNQTDAVLDVVKERLYFQNFVKIRPLFAGIEDYYRIATDKEIEQFCGKFSSVVKIENSVLSKIGNRNKKNIAALMDNQKLVKKIKAKNFTDWKKYAEKHQGDFRLNKKKDRFKCDSNKDLADILKIILEKYYKGEVTKTKKEAL